MRALKIQSAGLRTLLVLVILLLPLSAGFGVWIGADRYWLPRYESGDIPVIHQGETSWDDYFDYLEENFFPCDVKSLSPYTPEWNGTPRCWQSKPGQDIALALVGDSHAEHLFLGLAEALPERNVAYFLNDSLPVAAEPGVRQIIQSVVDHPSIKTVIVSGAWVLRGSLPDRDVSRALAPLLNDRRIDVYVADDIPVFPFVASRCKYGKTPWLPLTDCSIDATAFNELHRPIRSALERVVGQSPGVRIVETARYFCDEAECRMTSSDGRLLYRDNNHLNMTGSRWLARRVIDDNPDAFASLAAAEGKDQLAMP
jgi:hypothetical protein